MDINSTEVKFELIPIHYRNSSGQKSYFSYKELKKKNLAFKILTITTLTI